MIIHFYTCYLPLRLAALPLSKGKQLQTGVSANFKIALNLVRAFSP